MPERNDTITTRDNMIPKSDQKLKKKVVRSKEDVQIGTRIRNFRREQGLTTREFARGIPGLRSSNLSEIERGVRRCSAGVLRGITQKYLVDVSWLLTGKQPSGQPPVLRLGVQRARLLPVLSEAETIAHIRSGLSAPPPATHGEYAPAVLEDPHAFYVRVEGGTGGGAVTPGDLLLIESRRPPGVGDCAIAAMDGNLRSGKFELVEDEPVMVAHNRVFSLKGCTPLRVVAALKYF